MAFTFRRPTNSATTEALKITVATCLVRPLTEYLYYFWTVRVVIGRPGSQNEH
jgi:hypothetical protein